MKIITVLMITIMALFKGCSTNENSYYLSLDDANLVSTKTKIYSAGIEVGKVTEIGYKDNKASATIAITNDEFKVAKDAEFSVDIKNIFGGKAINIKNNSTDYLEYGSTINVTLANNNNILDILSKTIGSGDLSKIIDVKDKAAFLDSIKNMGGDVNNVLKELEDKLNQIETKK